MPDAEIQKQQPCSSSTNLLKPVELILQMLQQMIDLLISQLEWLIKFLSTLKVPAVNPLSPSQAALYMRLQASEEFYNLLDLPRNILVCQLKTITLIRKTIFEIPFWSARLVTKPISLAVGCTIDTTNNISERVQPYVPIKIPKLEWPSWLTLTGTSPTSFLEFYKSLLDSLVALSNKQQAPFPKNPFESLLSRFPSLRKQKGVTQIEKYNQELIELIEKERELYLQNISKLSSAQEEGNKANDELEQTKREFDSLKQELLLKIAKEIDQHKQDVEQLTLQSQKDKVESEEKLTELTNNFDKQKQEFQKTIDTLTLLNKDSKTEYEEKLQKMTLDCKQHTQELLDKIEAGKQTSLELEQLKEENEKQKTAFFERTSKEREAHQKELDELVALRRGEKAKNDEKIAQLNKDFAAQKQALLDQNENDNKDCLARIEKLKLEYGSDKSQAGENLTKANETLEAQKQELLSKITKEREQYKQDIDKLAAKSRLEKSNSDARIAELTRDLEKQKQDYLEDVNKERESIQQQIQKALDAQKIKFDVESNTLKSQILTLQNKIAELGKTTDKPKGIFGTLNDTLSKPAEVADKATKPLQEPGFGKIFN